MITLNEAKCLQYRTILYHTIYRNSDGTPQRWRVNGKPKTWKRSPERVEIPLKCGLYDYGYLTEDFLDCFCLTEKEASFKSLDEILGLVKSNTY